MQQGVAIWWVLIVVLAVAAVALLAWQAVRPAPEATPIPSPGLESAGSRRTAASSTAILEKFPAAVLGWQGGETATYDPESIFGYINGHAEVFLAYGMKECLSRRYLGPDGEGDLVLDLFEMASPADAYGVFTHDQDGEAVGIGQGSLWRYGWLSFWQGPWFVSIVAEGESDRARQAALELGQAVAGFLPAGDDPPAIVSDLPADGLTERSVRFLRSSQILNTHLYLDPADLFHLTPATAAVLGSYSRREEAASLLLIDYPDATAATAAQEAVRSHYLPGGGDGPEPVAGLGWLGLSREGKRLAMAVGSDSRELAAELLGEALASGSPTAPEGASSREGGGS